ncbi:hypothetical protein KPL76_06270 [Subtercola sp. PAMC28395]|uniref:hypothetical protein n=1 Tax=Subtercola sp. PAMC28395 TaxID=2846775 RepID=UPI001C0E4F52|nr:hypothetical protein [Subtercola sp. PAMC28395]QWT24959.1 hypothetical protein KPL76_06270 [Subtercola sp. PAMC28395]
MNEVTVTIALPAGVFEGFCDLATELEMPVTNMMQQILITARPKTREETLRVTGSGRPTPSFMVAEIARLNRDGCNDTEIAELLHTTAVNVGRHRRAMQLPTHYTRKNKRKRNV